MPEFDDNVYARTYQALPAANTNHAVRRAALRKWVIFGLLCSCLAVALFASRTRDRVPHPPPNLDLHSMGPDLLISWSGLGPETSQPDLHIVDGSTITDIGIKEREKISGQTVYRRQTARVEVLLLTEGGRNTEARKLFTGRQPLAPSSPDGEIANEVERLRARNRRLEAFVHVLRARLVAQPKR